MTCRNCGIEGIHACVGVPITSMSPAKIADLKKVLSEYEEPSLETLNQALQRSAVSARLVVVQAEHYGEVDKAKLHNARIVAYTKAAEGLPLLFKQAAAFEKIQELFAAGEANITQVRNIVRSV